MSVIASFYLLPTDKLVGLREIWPDDYEYLNKHGKEYFDYRWSGSCFHALIMYLETEKKIDLGKSDYNLLFPSAISDGTWFLDARMKKEYLALLDPKKFSAKELRNCLEDYFGGEGPKSAAPLLEALGLIKQSLELVNEKSVMLMHLG